MPSHQTEKATDITDPSSLTEMVGILEDASNINTLYLNNIYDSNNLISDFDNVWTNEILVNILDTQTGGQGISPSKYIFRADGKENQLVYAEATSENITRPYFTYNDALVRISNIIYSEDEERALENIYSKPNIKDAITEKVKEISSQILTKMNFNVEENFSFQKTKTKSLKFKNTSAFEEAPNVVQASTTTTTTTSGIY